MVLYGLGEMMITIKSAINGSHRNQNAITDLKKTAEEGNDSSKTEQSEEKERSTPETEKASILEKRETTIVPLRTVLEFAGKYSTDSGMTGYLRGAMNKLSDEDRVAVEQLIMLPPSEMRETMKKMVENT